MEDLQELFAPIRLVPLQNWGGCSLAANVTERRTCLGAVKLVDILVAIDAQNDRPRDPFWVTHQMVHSEHLTLAEGFSTDRLL